MLKKNTSVPVCILSWIIFCWAVKQPFPQNVHLYGLSPVCIFSCVFSLLLHWKVLSQITHWIVFSLNKDGTSSYILKNFLKIKCFSENKAYVICTASSFPQKPFSILSENIKKSHKIYFWQKNRFGQTMLREIYSIAYEQDW